jgi:catechol 2,3-dioxygenase-like lactoylglutathione lyase family enzyme
VSTQTLSATRRTVDRSQCLPVGFGGENSVPIGSELQNADGVDSRRLTVTHPMRIIAIDHVQLVMPPGGEDAARAFYADVLGLEEVSKPGALAGRGGAWFQTGSVRLHLGVEADFRPARKAHPALEVDDLAALIARCESAGHPVTRDVMVAGMDRVHVLDPFGNRIELLERQARG